MSLAIDLHVDLINMPSPVAKATQPADPLTTDVGSEHRTEAVPPQPHRLVAEVDAPLKEQILHIPQRKWIPHV